MPSKSAAQHRLIGYWHSHPEARPSSMSAGRVDEWLHADRGKPWERSGLGAARRDAGGYIGIDPGTTLETAQPFYGSSYQKMAALPAEKLRETVMRLPPNSMQAMAARKALTAKMMAPSYDAGTQPAGLTQPQQLGGLQAAAEGGALHRAAGGSEIGLPLSLASPWWTRAEERNMDANTTGYLHGATLGRADAIATTAPSGSHIIPADVVSGLGEGNSLAGAAVIDRMLSTGPWGTRLPHPGGRGHSMPHPPPPARYETRGGGVDADRHEPVPVMLSHGEYQVGPEHVEAIGRHYGRRDMTEAQARRKGHDILDHFIVETRRRIVRKMQKLPGPAKS